MLRKLARTVVPRRWRRLELPQAVVIGAQKCGTTALAAYLTQHPQLACSQPKELDFFGSDLRYPLGLDWYAGQWPKNDSASVMRFEASPQYMFIPQAAARLRECLPAVRLVALLRDPVHRAYSAWQMYRRQLAADPQFYHQLITAHYSAEQAAAFVRRTDAELADFSLAVEREVECLERGQSMEWSVVELGLYGPQLRRYVELFPLEQLMILDAAQLRSERASTLNRVLHFLGLKPWDWSQADLSDVFVGSWTDAIPAKTCAFLREYYAPSNRMLAGFMTRLPDWADASLAKAA
jgi:lipopolysaccharide transport system ATP-binding protein